MPEEVFSSWIGEIIEVNGWPFCSIDDPYPHQIWANFFLGLPLAYWANAIWTQSSLQETREFLTPESARLVVDVGTHAMFGFPAFIGIQVANSAARVHAHRSFIERERRFPGFLTGLNRGDGILHLVDGNHRLAALWSLGMNIEVPVWSATM